MNCFSAPYCGVLVLSSGLGSGAYGGGFPSVHGLWPQAGAYGNSDCGEPSLSSEPPQSIQPYSCYTALGLARQEWNTHGRCAGVRDADDYFRQVCELARRPIEVMVENTGDLQAMSSALRRSGYSIYRETTENQEVYLSACAGSNGRWQLSDQANFDHLCGTYAVPEDCYSTSTDARAKLWLAGGLAFPAALCLVCGMCGCALGEERLARLAGRDPSPRREGMIRAAEISEGQLAAETELGIRSNQKAEVEAALSDGEVNW